MPSLVGSEMCIRDRSRGLAIVLFSTMRELVGLNPPATPIATHGPLRKPFDNSPDQRVKLTRFIAITLANLSKRLTSWSGSTQPQHPLNHRATVGLSERYNTLKPVLKSTWNGLVSPLERGTSPYLMHECPRTLPSLTVIRLTNGGIRKATSKGSLSPMAPRFISCRRRT